MTIYQVRKGESLDMNHMRRLAELANRLDQKGLVTEADAIDALIKRASGEDAYVYQAALLCEDCGKETREQLTAQGKAPEDPDDEHSYDSDDFPKGPYPDGGGEADVPQHCDQCQKFLANPLTSDGEKYVQQANKRGKMREDWKERYSYLFGK